MRLLLTALLTLLVATQPSFPLPRGRASPGAPALTLATYSNNAETTGYVQVTLQYAGAPPGSVSASWSGSGGSATVVGLQTVGRFVTFWASAPASSGTYTLNGTGWSTGSVTISTGVSDFSAGIHGPTTVTTSADAYGNPVQQGVSSYFVRGLAGPARWSLSGADAGNFFLSGSSLTNLAYVQLGCAPCHVTLNATDGVSGYALPVTVNVLTTGAPAANVGISPGNDALVSYITDAYHGPTAGGNYVVGSVYLWSAASFTYVDPSGLLSVQGNGNGSYITISPANLAAHVGTTINLQITPAGGSAATYPVYLVHEGPPSVLWTPGTTLYSSSPATNGFGTFPVGTLSYNGDSGAGTVAETANPTGALDVYGRDPWWGRTGSTYLLSQVSAGTLPGTAQAATVNATTTNVVFSLPVNSGVTLPSSDISVSVTSGLDNYVVASRAWAAAPLAAGYDAQFGGTLSGCVLTVTSGPSVGTIKKGAWLFGGVIGGQNVLLGQVDATHWSVSNNGGSCSSGAGTMQTVDPVVVAHVTVSGLTPDWSTAVVDVPGTSLQVDRTWTNEGTVGNQQPQLQIANASGASADITAWYLDAGNETTPGSETIQLTVSDGAGNFVTKQFTITPTWHSYSGAPITICPSGCSFTSVTNFQQAQWSNPSTYAGATVTLMRGAGSGGINDWGFDPCACGSTFTRGWWAAPTHLVVDHSTQWTGNASVSGKIMTVNSTASGTLVAGDWVNSGAATGTLLISQIDSTHWNINVTQNTSATTMTTRMAHLAIDMGGLAIGGSAQGGLMGSGGYDVIIEDVEILNTRGNGGTAGAIYVNNDQSGFVTLNHVYLHESDNCFLNGDGGRTVTITNSLITTCGPGGNIGTSHNLYVGPVNQFNMSGTYVIDSLGHNVKTRAYNVNVHDNHIMFGVNWQGWDSPVQSASGGIMTLSNNTIMMGPSDNVSQNGDIVETNNEIAGNPPFEPPWPVNAFTSHGNIIVNLAPQNGLGPPFQPIVAYAQVAGNTDNITGIPFSYDIDSNQIYNLTSAQWSGVSPYAPPLGTHNAAISTLPTLTDLALIDPLTNGPPFNTPNRAIILSNATPGPGGNYAIIQTVAPGASVGTAVSGGPIYGYDSNTTQMTGITPSVSSGWATTLSGNGAQIKVNTSGLTSGIYEVFMTMTGTGTAPLPAGQYMPVIVQ